MTNRALVITRHVQSQGVREAALAGRFEGLDEFRGVLGELLGGGWLGKGICEWLRRVEECSGGCEEVREEAQVNREVREGREVRAREGVQVIAKDERERGKLQKLYGGEVVRVNRVQK